MKPLVHSPVGWARPRAVRNLCVYPLVTVSLANSPPSLCSRPPLLYVYNVVPIPSTMFVTRLRWLYRMGTVRPGYLMPVVQRNMTLSWTDPLSDEDAVSSRPAKFVAEERKKNPLKYR